jgi:hypothetical protein
MLSVMQLCFFNTVVVYLQLNKKKAKAEGKKCQIQLCFFFCSSKGPGTVAQRDLAPDQLESFHCSSNPL